MNQGAVTVCNNATLDYADVAMAKALNVGKYFRKFPVKYEDVGQFCDEEFEYIRDIEDYKDKCLKQLPKQLTSIIIYTVKQMIKSLCRKDSKRVRRLLSGAPCANAAQLDYARCLYRYTDALQGTYYDVDKRKIPHTCCEYYKIYGCMREGAKKHSVCTAERIEANVEYVTDVFSNVMNTLCGDWNDDSDKCTKLPALLRKRKSDKRTASFLWPFIKVLESFPEV